MALVVFVLGVIKEQRIADPFIGLGLIIQHSRLIDIEPNRRCPFLPEVNREIGGLVANRLCVVSWRAEQEEIVRGAGP